MMLGRLATGITVLALCVVLPLTLIVQGAWHSLYEKASPEIVGAAILGAVVYVAVGVALLVSWLRLRRRAIRAREATRA